jgi:hypothetical protein
MDAEIFKQLWFCRKHLVYYTRWCIQCREGE